jgi:F-type H+-transporting ATPase subunit epsilon
VGVPLRVVSVEGSLFDQEVDGNGRPFLIVRGIDGEMGILPRHEPLMTTLKPGPMLIRNGSEETELFVGGGFIEILPDRVTVLADVAERVDEISAEAAEEARRHAQERLSGDLNETEEKEMQALLAVAEARVRLIRERRHGSS